MIGERPPPQGSLSAERNSAQLTSAVLLLHLPSALAMARDKGGRKSPWSHQLYEKFRFHREKEILLLPPWLWERVTFPLPDKKRKNLR